MKKEVAFAFAMMIITAGLSIAEDVLTPDKPKIVTDHSWHCIVSLWRHLLAML